MDNRAEIKCPLCGKAMKPDENGSFFTCPNKSAKCANYGRSFRVPRMVKEK